LAEGAITARWRMGDSKILRIDLNLSAQSASLDPETTPTEQIIFATPPHAAELSRRGTLNPYTAIVSLIATDALEEQDDQ
jgi:maltooligosyltrehalose trehalohydrolase